MTTWLVYLIVFILAVAIIIRVILGKKVGTGYVYKVAFAVVTAIFVYFLAIGIYLMTLAPSSWMADFWPLFIVFAILSLPLEVWLGIKVFRKRSKEDVERVRYGSTESTHEDTEKTSIRLTTNIAGLLCYVLGWISGVVFILIERKNSFIRFHAMQSIIVFGILSIVGIVLFLILGGGLLIWIFGAVTFMMWMVMMVEASQGKRFKVPWVGKLAEKYT